MKTRKVLDICACGTHLVGYYAKGEQNPWKLYRVWHDDRNHRRLIVKYANFISMVKHIDQYYSGVPDAWQD